MKPSALPVNSANARFERDDLIIENLTALALAIGEKLVPERQLMYVRVLSALSEQELDHGFARALKEAKFWPKPSELIEFCTGKPASMEGKMTAEAAWTWIVNYLEVFGDPTLSLVEIQGRQFNGHNPELAIKRPRQKDCPVTLATSAPFYEIKWTTVPEIGDLVSKILSSMSGTVAMGLLRFREALKFRYNKEFGSKDLVFLRKDFDEHATCILAAGSSHSASGFLNPARQLTRHLRLFPEPSSQHTIQVWQWYLPLPNPSVGPLTPLRILPINRNCPIISAF